MLQSKVCVVTLTGAFDVLMAEGEPWQKGECGNHLRGWGFRSGSVKLEATGRAKVGRGSHAPQGVYGG